MESKKIFIVNILYYGIILFFVYLGMKYLLPILFPFLFAFLVVWSLNYPASYLSEKWGSKWRLKKKWLLLTFLTMFYGLLFWLILQVGASAVPAIGSFVRRLPRIYTVQILPALQDAYQHLASFLEETNMAAVMEMEGVFEQGLAEIGTFISQSSGTMVRAISGYAASVPTLILKIVVSIVASYFTAADYDHIVEVVFSFLPQKGQVWVNRVADQTKNVVVIFFRSYTLLMLLTFVELFIGLSLLNIPYGGWIALLISVFDILPILGTGGVLIPWAIIAALIGEYSMAVGIIVTYLIITVIRNTLEPRLVGRQIGLHPLVTLISMFVGARLFGLAGLFGFPLTLSIMVRMKK